jgi:malate dehydrogenase (oxaloacetate-decarboxylating)(NADP+)
MESGVAARPISDFATYQDRLGRFVFRSGFIMKPVFAQAKAQMKRVIYAEGEDERTLRATQVVVEEGLARPILIGRPAIVEARIKRFGLAIKPDRDFDLVNPEDDPRYRTYVQALVEATGRKGLTPDAARTLVRTNSTVIAALAMQQGLADAMICGLEGRYMAHLRYIRDIVGRAPGIGIFAALSTVISAKGVYFLADTHINENPTAAEIAEMAVLAATQVRRFGVEPKIALLSRSDFGSYECESGRKMRAALDLILAQAPELEVDGDMNGESALVPAFRNRVYPHSRLTGEANVLIMPNIDAANIAYQMIKVLGDALPVGPILIGAARPAHILTPSTTARGVVNMTAFAAVDAQQAQEAQMSLGLAAQ